MIATQQYVRKFQDFQAKVDVVDVLLKEAKSSPLSKKHLLNIHYELYHLEEFKDITLHTARDSSQDVVLSLNRLFRPVTNLVTHFTSLLWEISGDIFELIEQDQLRLLVQVAKIIEIEESADRQAELMNKAKEQNLKLVGLTGSNSKWKLTEGSPREVKNLKDDLFTKYKELVQRRFQDFLKQIDRKDLSDLLDTLAFVPEDLHLIQQHATPCFPPEYQIFDLFISEYHNTVHETVQNILTNVAKLEGGEILKVLRFAQDYLNEMELKVGYTEDMLEPKLLGANQSLLINNYLIIVRAKLTEWTNNIVKEEIKKFTARADAPYVTEDGTTCLSSSIVMFQVFDQQIDAAIQSHSDVLMIELIKEFIKACQIYQQGFSQILNEECTKYLEDPDSYDEGFLHYIIALMNDQLRSIDLGDNLLEKASGFLNDTSRERAAQSLEEQTDGFLHLTDEGNMVIIEIILDNIRPYIGMLYTAKWYEDPELMPSIMGTIQDYLNDINGVLHPYLFTKLCSNLLEQFVIEYIRCYFNKGGSFKMPQCADMLDNDKNLINQVFFEYIEQEIVLEQVDPISKLTNIITATPNMIFMDVYPLRQQYPDVPLKLIEELLKRRDDLNKAQFKEVIEGIKSKQDIQNASDTQAGPTIFSKLDTKLFSKNLREIIFN
jgi:hypothetical protein